jgi:DNA helicase MCM8
LKFFEANNLVQFVTAGKAKSKNDGLLYLYIEAVSVVNSKDTNKEGQLEPNEQKAPGPPNALAFTSRDLEFVTAFAEETGSDLFRTILHSICPSIYGHELVKGTSSFYSALPRTRKSSQEFL